MPNTITPAERPPKMTYFMAASADPLLTLVEAGQAVAGQ